MRRIDPMVAVFPRERIVRRRPSFQRRHADGRPDFTDLRPVERSFRVVR